MGAVEEFEGVSQGRSRRALGLIAISLALALVAGIIYLRPFARPASPAPLPTPVEHFNLPSSMEWVSAGEGWLVFNDGNNHATLFHTRDAGRHWQANLLVSGRAGRLTFFDAGRGVVTIRGDAAAVSVLQTTDGGRSWQLLHLPELTGRYLLDVPFSDPRHAWLAAPATQPYLAGATTFDLYRTDNGGEAWQRFPGGALKGLPAPPQGAPLFATSRDGWVLIDRQLYSSHDGGDSWQPETLDLSAATPDSAVSLVQASLSPGGRVALTLEGFPPSGQVPRGVDIWVAASSDGGHTWQPPVHIPETQSPSGNPSQQPPEFTDAWNGWLAVGPAMYTTADSGRSWNRKAMPSGAPCVDVTPVTAGTAWCAGQSAAAQYPKGFQVRLFRTVDGGRHWSGVDPPV